MNYLPDFTQASHNNFIDIRGPQHTSHFTRSRETEKTCFILLFHNKHFL